MKNENYALKINMLNRHGDYVCQFSLAVKAIVDNHMWGVHLQMHAAYAPIYQSLSGVVKLVPIIGF